MSAIILVAGCCSGRKCAPCREHIFTVYYGTAANDSCPLYGVEDVLGSTWALENDTLISVRGHYFEGCQVDLEFVDAAYWVISSDSLGISDTLTVANLIWSDPCKGCCCCPQEIISASFSLRGAGYSQDGEVDADRTIIREL